jgi:hypothetical protein
MNYICWNCRGLGSDATVGELRWLIATYRPSFVFLSETKMKDKCVQKFMWTLGFTGRFAVSCEGLSGGLALFWLQPFSVDLKGFNAHCMNVVVSSADLAPWHVSFVYGEPRREKRHEFWSLLRRLHNQRKGPWLVCGDFNEALTQDEHAGLVPRTATQMELFRSCLDDCGLMDLGFSGPRFTWSNKQEGRLLSVCAKIGRWQMRTLSLGLRISLWRISSR